MSPSIDPDFLYKIEAIAQGPNADLLRRLVEMIYENEEEHFSAEDLAEIEAAAEAIRQGEMSQFVTWEEYKAKRGL